MPSSSRSGPILILVWLAAAVAVVATGLLARLPFPPPLFVGIGILFSLACVILVPGVAAWLRDLDIRAILAFHLVRFVGIYFLWLMTQGRLDPLFARQAGIGDIVTAIGAVLLLLIPSFRARKGAMIWNVIGFVDILLVVVNAVRVVLNDPAGFSEFYHLPLGLLPTFFVPVIIVSHVVVFLRLRRV
jgi:uncharacterized membrane protein